MKKTLIILLCLCANLIYSQNNAIKGRGELYTNGVPTVPINYVYDSEYATDTTNNSKRYGYNRDAAAWMHLGWLLQEWDSVSTPTYTPKDKQSFFVVNNGDSLFHYSGSTWNMVSGGGGSDTQDLSITGGGGTIRLVDGGYVVLNDSTITNEGLLSWNVSTNLLTLTSNTSGSETLLSAGRGITNLTDSSGYLLITSTEVDGSTTNEIQTLTATGDEGTLRLSSGGFVILNDSSSVNEGLIAWGVTANLADVISNTLGSETLYMAGRGITNITDSSGYMLYTSTEVDGSVSNEGVVTVNREADSTVYRITTNSSGSETLWLKEGNNITFSSPSSGTGEDTLIIGTTAGGGDISQGGNSFTAPVTIGSNDNYGMKFETNGITRMRLDTSSNLYIGATNALQISNSAITAASTMTFTSPSLFWIQSTNSSGTGILLEGGASSTNAFGSLTGANAANTSGTKYSWKVNPVFQPSSGTAVFSTFAIVPTINQTGGANGATYGIWINPTLTAAADWRGIQVDNNSGYGIHLSGASATSIYAAGEVQFDKQIRMLEIAAPGTPATGYVYIYPKSDGKLYIKDDAGTETDLTATGGSSSLSYDAVNREVDITGGGTSATLPLALDDGATEGLASFTAADFTVTSGNVAIDYSNGQSASAGSKGFLTNTDFSNFSNKQAAIQYKDQYNNEGSAGALVNINFIGAGVVAADSSNFLNVTITSGASTNTISLSGNSITSNVDGISDTTLVIGELTTTLSGNQITTEVNSITDTTLVIGELDISSATNTMTIEVNSVTDNALIINSNVVSYGTVDGILTVNINGISDTTLITGASDGNGIYSGSGTVATGAVADMGYISANETFVIGHGLPTEDYDDTEYGLKIESTSSGLGLTSLWGADSVAQIRSLVLASDQVQISAANNATSQSGYVQVIPDSYTELSATQNGQTSTVRVIGDSVRITTAQLRANIDTLTLKIAGSHGTSGQVLTSNGYLATWQTPSGGVVNLSYDAANHEIDISGGGTSAIIPLALADGATEGLASFSATYFDASSGNITPDLTNGLASGSQGGFLSTTDWTTFNTKANKSIYSDNGLVDSTRYTNIHVDSVLTFGYMTSHPSYALNGKERALYFDEDRRVSLIGGDSLTSVYTLIQLSNAISMFSSKSDLSDYSTAQFETAAITLRATDVGDSQDSYWYIKPDSIHGVSKRFRVDVDSFNLKIAGSNGTTGQILMSNGAGWSATWATVGVLTDSDKGDITVSSSGTVWNIDAGVVGATEVNDDEIILQNGNTIAAAFRIGSNDNNTVSLEVQDTVALQFATSQIGTFIINTSNTSTVTDQVYFDARSYNTPAAGFGTSLMFKLESTTTESVGAATIAAYWTTPTHATNEAALSFQLADAGGSLGEVLKLDRTTSTGLLSIGSTTPLLITSSTISGQVAGGLVITGGTAVGDSIIYKNTTANGTDSLGAHVFKVDNNGGTTAMTIRNNGSIGIGNTAPLERLSIGPVSAALSNGVSDGGLAISGTGSINFGLENTSASSASQGSGALFYSNDGAAMASGDRLGFVLFGGSSSVSSIRNTVGLTAFAEETWVDATNYGSGIRFETTLNGGTTRNEKLRITNNGSIWQNCGSFSAVGDAAQLQSVLRRAITGTAATELFIDGASLQATLAASTLWTVEITLIASCKTQGNGTTVVGEGFVAKRYCGISRVGSTTALIGTVETIGTDKSNTTMSTSATTITADDTNEALKITFTPPSTAGSTTVFNVVATYKITQVQY